METKILPLFNLSIEGSRIVSISKPPESVLRKIFALIKRNKVTFGRSEFYRTSIFVKILFQIFEADLKAKIKQENEDPNLVRVPIETDEEGNHTFRTYKILKKIDIFN